MLIPSKYLVKEGTDPESGSLCINCKICKKMFAIPPKEITADLASATVCDNEDCAKAASAAEQVSAATAAAVDLDHTSSLK